MTGSRVTVTFGSADSSDLQTALRRLNDDIARLAQATRGIAATGHSARPLYERAPRQGGREHFEDASTVFEAVQRTSQGAAGLARLAERERAALAFERLMRPAGAAAGFFKIAGGSGSALASTPVEKRLFDISRIAGGINSVASELADPARKAGNVALSTITKVAPPPMRAAGAYILHREIAPALDTAIPGTSWIPRLAGRAVRGDLPALTARTALRAGWKLAPRALGAVAAPFDALTLVEAITGPAARGLGNQILEGLSTTAAGLGLGLAAGTPFGPPGLIIGGTVGGLIGLGAGLFNITKPSRATPAARGVRRPPRNDRLAWLRIADYLRWQARTGGGFAPEEASGNLATMMRTIASRPRVAAANLAEPFTRPLAEGIQRARRLSADNVAAVLGQFKLLGPRMRQVTATALRDQVMTMERHRQVVAGTARGLVMAINSQWPKIDPASRRAVTQAITHMSARMASGRHVLNPEAQKLAEGIRAAMQGPFGGIVKDFGNVVGGLVSTVTSGSGTVSSGSRSSSAGGGNSVGKAVAEALRPPPGSRNWKGYRPPAIAWRKGGRIPSLVSPGELIVHGDRSWTVPGARTAADNVLAMLPVGSAVLTDHGQALMAAGFGLDGALAHQMPHFGKGGTTGGATMGYTVHARLGQLVDRTTSIAGDRPKLLARAMRELRRVLADTELVAYRRVRQLGADVREKIAALRRDGLRGSERRQVKRLRDDLRAVEHEVDRRLARLASNARQVLEDPASRSTDIARAIGGRSGRRSSGLYLGLDRARARHDRRAARAFRREIAAGRRAYAQSIFDSATSTPEDVLTAIGSQTGRRTGLYAQLDRARRRHDRNSARAIKAQIAAGRQVYQQRAYARQESDIALDDLALSGSPDDPGLRQRKLDHLQAYRGALASDLDRAKRSNDFEAISDLAARLQAVGESIRDLTDATEQQRAIAQQRMDLDRELADNQRRMLAVAESQPNVLLGGLVAAVNGGIGGRVGLGFQTPGYAGRGVRY